MVNYKLINDVIEYYESKGYSRVEVPWLVTSEIDNLTKPKDAEPFIVSNKNKNLIASAEQGFLYNENKGFLPPGRYIAVSPCFRNDTHDLTHHKNFMKAEIYITDLSENPMSQVDELIGVAMEFFDKKISEMVPDECKIRTYAIPNSEGGMDVNFNGVEIGSYGYRVKGRFTWIYGTALAEPRFSNLIKEQIVKYKNNGF